MNERTDHAFLRRVLRPGVVFPFVMALTVLSILISPKKDPGAADTELTVTATSPGGAAAFAETLRRLGWKVSRSEQPVADIPGGDSVVALLAPAAVLTGPETHALLERVRAGGAAFVVFSSSSALADSLKLTDSRRAGAIVGRADDLVVCPTESPAERRIRTLSDPYVTGMRPRAPFSSDTIHFAISQPPAYFGTGPRNRPTPTILGVAYGAGKLVLVSDGTILANDVLRICRSHAGVAAIRAIAWLSDRGDGPRREVVFAEYYFGYGLHPSIWRAGREWLTRTPSGRTTAQVLLAALVLLAAFAPRPIKPVTTATMARRSPLEHVGALARAYEQVRATRTAAKRLVQGLRRRTMRPSAAQAATDEGLLQGIAQRVPGVRAHTTRVLGALRAPVSPAELIGVAESVDHIERALHK